MKLKSIVFAAGLIAIPALALAQTSAPPPGATGQGATGQPTTQMGTGGQMGNMNAAPTRKHKKHARMHKRGKAPTTGSNIREQQMRNASPSSPTESIKKEK